jgi:hypothetical protein
MSNFGSAKLLTSSHNYAVVQLPGRQFPDVVFQGDSLHILETHLSKLLVEMKSQPHDDDMKRFII